MHAPHETVATRGAGEHVRLGPFASRFRIERVLGSGGYGTVYRALDEVQRRRVALKVPHTLDARALLALKEEFRSLAGISHPNLVAFHELFVGPEQSFFTMDLVRGVDCVRWIERAGPAAIHDVVRGLASGLEALHAARIVHRDLKPSNAWVDTNGVPVLLDFGLARAFDRDVTAETLAGTPAYLAPELLRGAQPSPASDLYALGVVMYEMVVGRPPFEGSSMAVLGQKLLGGPVRVKETRASGLAELVPVIESLLDADPERRPSASEIVRVALRDLAPSRSSAGALPFVGREAELASLERALAQAQRGEPRVVFLEGPAGIGKSTLVDRFVARIAAPDVLVLRGRCSEHEAVPFKALDALVDALARRLRDDDELREEVPDLEALALVAEAFPVFGQVLAELETAPPPPRRAAEAQERRRRAARALAEVLGSIARKRALVLVIDDLHWADEDGASVLCETLGALGAARVLLLALHRDGVEREPLARIRTLDRPTAGVAGASALVTERLVVPPLSPAEAHALLGSSVAGTVEREVLEAAAGSPFLLETLGAARTLGRATVPSSVTEGLGADLVTRAVAARMEALAPSARAVLEAVCAAGHAIAHDVVAEALGVDVDVAALRALGAARLVRTAPALQRGGAMEIEAYHDRLREVVLTLIEPPRRSALHAALARVFVSRTDADPMWACMHLEASGQLERAARYAEEGAHRAAQSLAFVRAAELYRFALAHHAPDDARARSLEVALAEALANAGRGREAADAFLVASKRAPELASQHELARRAAEQYLRAGFFHEGVQHLEAVLEAAGIEPRRTPLRAVVSLVRNRIWLRRRGLDVPDVARSEPDPAERRRIEVLRSGAVGLSVVDSIRSADLMSEALRRSLANGDRAGLGAALSWWAAFIANEGGPAEQGTRAILEAARREIDAHGDAYGRGCFEAASGLTEFHLGAFGTARAHFEKGLRIFEQETRGTTKEASTLHIFHHATLAIDGRLGELARRTDERVRISESRGERYALVNYRQGLMILRWLASDRPDLAEHDLERAMEHFDIDGFVVQHWFDAWGRIATLLYRGRAGQARRVWVATRRRLLASLLVRTQFTRVHSYALEAMTAAAVLAEGDASAAERARLRAWARVAIRWIAAEDRAWTAALARLLEACLLGAEGAEDEARAVLASAVPALERSELGLYAALARHHLGANEVVDRQRAAEWAAREGVVDLDRLARGLLPGFRPRA